MNISDIVSNFLTSQSVAGKATQQSAADPITAAFKKAGDRIEQQIGTTQVKLSAFGQIKGAFAELQTSSKALTDTKQTATADDLKKAIGSFVAAYNKANKTVSAATQPTSKSTPAGALVTDNRARIAGSDLTRSIASSSTLSDLKSVGITQNKDGSLALDTKALDNALKSNPDQVRSSFASVGSKVEKTATSELASSGNVGASVDSLSKRSATLAAQQTAQQDQQTAAQRQLDQQNATINNVFASGLVAYQRTFNG